MPTLLTGVGYIGAALLRRLVELPDAQPIVALDNGFSTSLDQVAAALPSGTPLIQGDVSQPGAVNAAFDRLGSDRKSVVVFHLAAQPSAALAVSDPELTERSNLVGGRVLLEAARARDARVVFGSSFRVYGDDLVGQTVDERTPYGRVGDLSHLSKVYVEQLARMLGVPFVSVRLGVTYGLSPIMKTTPALMTVPNLFCQQAARGQPLRLRENRPVAFVHVADAVDALLKAAQRSGPVFDVVNAAPEVTTIGALAGIVRLLAARRGLAPVQVGGAAPSEAHFLVTSSLYDDGWRPRHSLGDSLGQVLDFFVDAR